MNSISDDLNKLAGEPINAVSFVMDYVEFHFNGPVLRSYTNPRIKDGNTIIVFDEPGSRDALCSIIEDVVSDIVVEEDRAIVVNLKSNRQLIIPLDQASRTGIEAANYVDQSCNMLIVW